jgi:tetratricopeptide (TPR) repeat protein
MAELGAMAGMMGQEEGAKPIEINVDMLDFGFVEECNDVATLKGICEQLKNNEYGYYPDLEAKALEKLFSLLPAAEVMKMKRLQYKTTPQEVADAEASLSSWSENMSRRDAAIRGAQEGAAAGPTDSSDIFSAAPLKTLPKKRALPPVRGSQLDSASATRTVTSKASSPGQAEEKQQQERLSGYDFQAWDKFDAEEAGRAVDDEKDLLASLQPGKSLEQLKLAQVGLALRAVCPVCRVPCTNPPLSPHPLQLEKRTAAHQKEMQLLQAQLGAEGLSSLQRAARAGREKTKGNECFRIGENQEALDCYARSLALDPVNPVTYANRAMAALRLERYELAEDDCSRAVQLDPSYVKAWSRRGMSRFKRGNYKGSAEDFDMALRLDPHSAAAAEMRKLCNNARAKYLEVEGKSLPLRDQSDASSVALTLVRNHSDMRLPPHGAEEVGRGKCSVTLPLPAATAFTRIQISEDDSEEEEQAAPAAEKGFVRIAIQEESDSEEEEGEEAAAEAAAAPAVQVDPAAAAKRAVELKDEGNRHMKAAAHQQAVAAYSQALLLAPNMAAALNNRAMAYLALKQYAAVVADATAVLGLEATNSKALYRRAQAQRCLGARTAALQDVTRVLQLDPANAQALQLHRDVLALPADAAAAASGRGAATELDMQGAKTLALAALEEGDHAGAVRLLEAALRSNFFLAAGNVGSIEVKVSLLHLLHTAQLRNGDAEAAQEALGRILAVAPNNFKALLRRAEVLKQLGRTAEAKADVLQALAAEPANSAALALLASLSEVAATQAASLKEAGNEAMAEQQFQHAVNLYTQAMTADPTGTIAVNNRAQAYLKLGRFAEAVADASSVVHKCRGQAEQLPLLKKALFRRAFSLREAGPAQDLRAARADFAELAQLEPDNRAFQQELARTEAAIKAPGPPAAAEPAASGLEALGMTEKTTVKRAVAEVAGGGGVPTAADAPPPAPAAAGESAKKPAPKAAPAKISPLKRPTVPTDPPKTVYELEKVWRALKSYPDLFAQYLAGFKKSTYKKVFKETLSSELQSSVFLSLRDHASAATVVATLTGIAAMSSFDMTLSLLPAGDLALLRQVLDKPEVAAHEACAELRAKYKL